MFVILLVLLEVILFAANFKPGTFFMGWDNLFPEMNFSANFLRSLFGVWQEYRGLGFVDGMSFAANLPHYLFLWLLSLALPLDMLRYVFFFLMHFLGGLGMYKLVSVGKGKLVGFFAAVFYLLNLATIQMFYAPYELFAVHFAFLPWLIYFVRRFGEDGRRRDLFYFGLVSVLTVPQAHVPTIFLVYLLTVGVFLVGANLKRAIVILATIFAVNAFWLLPYGYFVANHTQTVVEAKINEMSRANIELAQKARGNLGDVLSLRGFLLDAKEPGYIMAGWRDYLGNPLVSAISFLFLAGAVLGAGGIIVGKKQDGYPFVALSLVAIFFLGNDVPGLATVNAWLRSNFSLFGEVFRFSFTKFSILLAFSYSVLLAYGLDFLFKVANKRLVGSLFLIMMAVYSWPAFNGNFVYDSLRVEVPKEYFKAVDFFKGQDKNGRVALFPQPSYWSWRFYGFGYRGSGFLWYGIPQPTTDLAFDPWSRENENYYWEISYALYSKNLPLFESVLEKYRVSWLLVDENIVNPTSPKALFTDELKEMAGRSSKITSAESFGKIFVYKVQLTRPTRDFISVASGLPKAGPEYKWGSLDKAFWEFGDYVSAPGGVVYQFRTLFTGKRQQDLEFDPTKLTLTGSTVEVNPPYSLPTLSHSQGYLVTVESGKPGFFWIENTNSRRADLETYLPAGISHFVQPPMEMDGLGYTLHFDHEVGKVTIAPIDYWGLVGERQGEAPVATATYADNFTVEHPNPSFYRVDLSPGLDTVILAQSYEPGWLAVAVGNLGDVRVLGGHEKINNWANGWKLSSNERIVYLFFWPQLLEFAGFGLLTMTLIGIIIRSVKSSPH